MLYIVCYSSVKDDLAGFEEFTAREDVERFLDTHAEYQCDVFYGRKVLVKVVQVVTKHQIQL
jgi:hypothetical protein